jgi:nitrate/nitrite-specific signal transduction histidine kinase
MRERAELLKGNLDLLQPNGNGTMVRLTVPREKSEADAR